MRETRSASLINRVKLKDAIISENGQRENASPGDVVWVRIEGSSWWPAQVFDEASVSRKNKPRKKSACETLVRVYGTYNYLYVDLSRCRSDFENAFRHTKFSSRKILQDALEVLSCHFSDKSNGEIDAVREMTERSEDANVLSSVTNPSGKTDFNIYVDADTKIGDENHKIMSDNVVAETTKRHSRKRKAPGNVEEGTKDGATDGGKTLMQNKDADCPITRKDDNRTKRSKNQDCTTDIGNDDLHLVKTPDSNVRRIRMMQRLALIAPEGSPFRNGLNNVNP